MDALKEILIKLMKDNFVKIALKKLLGSVAAGGFKAWIVKYIATELFEEVAEPVVRFLVRKGQLVYDKRSGNIMISKVRRAIDENNDDDYWDAIGSI